MVGKVLLRFESGGQLLAPAPLCVIFTFVLFYLSLTCFESVRERGGVGGMNSSQSMSGLDT